MSADNNAMIAAIAENDELSDQEKLWSWVVMTNAEKLVDELKMSATLASMGMKTVSLTDQFAYGLMKLHRPDLFEPKEEA